MAAFVLSIPPIMGKQVLKLLKYIPAIFKRSEERRVGKECRL